MVIFVNLTLCTEANIEEQFKKAWAEAKIPNNESVKLFLISPGTLEVGDVNHTLASFLQLLRNYKQVTVLECQNFTCNEISEITLALKENQSSKNDAPLNHITGLIIHPLAPAGHTKEIQKDGQLTQQYFATHRKIIESICEDLVETTLKDVVISDTSVRYPQRNLMRSLTHNVTHAVEGYPIKVTLVKPKLPENTEFLPQLFLGSPIKRPPPEDTGDNKRRPVTFEFPNGSILNFVTSLNKSTIDPNQSQSSNSSMPILQL